MNNQYYYFQLEQQIEDKTQKLEELIKELHQETLCNQEVIYKELIEIKEMIKSIKK